MEAMTYTLNPESFCDAIVGQDTYTGHKMDAVDCNLYNQYQRRLREYCGRNIVCRSLTDREIQFLLDQRHRAMVLIAEG